MRQSSIALFSVGALLVASAGCDCGPKVNADGDGGSSDGGGGGQGSGGGGGSGGGTGEDGGFNPDAACARVSAEATLAKKPVDIIFVIDNSGSMTLEIIGVEDNINTNFAQIIAASGLDYRVIMLSEHGSATADQSICIRAPLSGNASCSPPPSQPANTANFFHYSTPIASTNSLRKILTTYNAPDLYNLAPSGWSQWLRADAVKTFVEITDDNETGITSQAFETQLFALTPKMFGDAQARNYLFHSIIGVAAKPNPSDAYQPGEPTVPSLCPSAVNAGLTYQALSKTVGGLRFPVCDPSRYGTVFQTVAQGVVKGAQVACDFAIPPPPAGYSLSNRIYVEYSPSGGGAPQLFNQVASLQACASASFYVEAGRVILCPDACTAVKADLAAKVNVFFTCEPSGIN
ncbi:MAG: hypothetical protein HYZ28_03920 [Myxococcales bacterium]|nr:hypothetical protein [Myxococcales bacterium]